MDRFKSLPGAGPSYPINVSIIEDIFKEKLHFARNKNGDLMYYAVCPLCDNPIQIVGLYAAKAVKPYGKHLRHSLPGLANYSQAAYDYCLYANPQKPNPKVRKKTLDENAKQSLKLLKERFDRVIYVLAESSGIRISHKLAEDMLRDFMGFRGYLYPWLNCNNLPWILGHLSGRYRLFGRIIPQGSVLRAKIEQDYPKGLFNETDQLIARNQNDYVDLQFLFQRHRTPLKDEGLDETLDLVVLDGSKNQAGLEVPFFRTTLKIDQARFMNLVHRPEMEIDTYRNKELLDLANNILSSLNF